MEKTCTKCKQIKDIIDFHAKREAKDGKRSQCKNCDVVKSKTYREKLKQRNNILLPEKKTCSSCRIEKEIHLFSKTISTKAGVASLCRSCSCSLTKKFNNTLKGYFSRYKTEAKRRQLNFDISFEEFEDLIKENNCHYCGQEAKGIDRINSDLGYAKNNCVNCCFVCNRIKMDLTKEELFLKLKQIIIKHNINTSE
jgi:hypothetical protein